MFEIRQDMADMRFRQEKIEARKLGLLLFSINSQIRRRTSLARIGMHYLQTVVMALY